MMPGTAVLFGQKPKEEVKLGDIFRVTEFTRGGYARLKKVNYSDIVNPDDTKTDFNSGCEVEYE